MIKPILKMLPAIIITTVFVVFICIAMWQLILMLLGVFVGFMVMMFTWDYLEKLFVRGFNELEILRIQRKLNKESKNGTTLS